MVGPSAAGRPARALPDGLTAMSSAPQRLGIYLALGALMSVLDTTVTTVAVPRLAADFSVTVAATSWVTTGYVLALVAVMPTAAWAMARHEARPTYLVAVTVFTLGSLAAGLAWNLAAMIAFRVVQGLGGGLLAPVGMAIALSAAAPGRRGRTMSLLGLPVLIGPLIGPILGGTLIDTASWRAIFWINVPLGLAAILIGRRILPPPPPAPAARGLDVAGLLLLCPGLALTVLGLSETGTHGTLASVQVLVPLLTGSAMVAFFTRRAWHTEDPLLSIRVLRAPATGASAATLALFAAAYFGTALLGPVYVQLVRGDSATLSGVIGVPQALATGLSLQIATRLVDRISPRAIVGTGIGTALIGTIARILVLTPTTSYWLVAALGGLTGVGIGATLMPTMTAGTRALGGDDLPAATTVLNVVSQTAVATGTALTGAVLTGLSRLLAPALPGGLTAAAGLGATTRAAYAGPLTDATRLTLAAAAALMAAAWLTSRRLPGTPATDAVRHGARRGG